MGQEADYDPPEDLTTADGAIRAAQKRLRVTDYDTNLRLELQKLGWEVVPQVNPQPDSQPSSLTPEELADQRAAIRARYNKQSGCNCDLEGHKGLHADGCPAWGVVID